MHRCSPFGLRSRCFVCRPLLGLGTLQPMVAARSACVRGASFVDRSLASGLCSLGLQPGRLAFAISSEEEEES